MFDVEHVLGKLVLGELTKSAAVRGYSGMSMAGMRSPRQSRQLGRRTLAERQAQRKAVREEQIAKREARRVEASEARALMMEKRQRLVEGAKIRAQQASARKAAGPQLVTGFPRQGFSPIDRNSADYQNRLAILYQSQGLTPPVMNKQTIAVDNKMKEPGITPAPDTAVETSVHDANKDIKATANTTAQQSRPPAPKGETPNTTASGVGTANTSAPPGPTTTNASPQPVQQVSGGVPAQMPTSGPSVSQGETTSGPSSPREATST